MSPGGENHKIFLVGGGSGGHITPLMAVAAELKAQNPDIRIVYIGKKGDNLADIIAGDKNIDSTELIRAGKFRRYPGESWLKRLLDIKTNLLNLRDALYTVAGIFQALKLMRRHRPNVIFIKGGFVGVPVGLAARLKRRPFITHDSDTVPGLANRIIGRWAALHTTGMPAESYTYAKETVRYVGIPLQSGFKRVTPEQKRQFRQQIGLAETGRLLFVIGGGLGARSINKALAVVLPDLLDKFEELEVVQVVGRLNENKVNEQYAQLLSDRQKARVAVHGFMPEVFRYSGAADVVVTRAGATNLAEFALQGKACVVIPSPHLTGGHQLKNAAQLTAHQAAVVLDDNQVASQPSVLEETIAKLFSDENLRETLERNITAFAKPDAAHELAKIIIEITDAAA